MERALGNYLGWKSLCPFLFPPCISEFCYFTWTPEGANPLLVFLFLCFLYTNDLQTFLLSQKLYLKAPNVQQTHTGALSEVRQGTQIPTCTADFVPTGAPNDSRETLGCQVHYWARYQIISCFETVNSSKTRWWGHGSPHTIFPRSVDFPSVLPHRL